VVPLLDKILTLVSYSSQSCMLLIMQTTHPTHQPFFFSFIPLFITCKTPLHPASILTACLLEEGVVVVEEVIRLHQAPRST
jgi:hypothetical protein